MLVKDKRDYLSAQALYLSDIDYEDYKQIHSLCEAIEKDENVKEILEYLNNSTLTNKKLYHVYQEWIGNNKLLLHQPMTVGTVTVKMKFNAAVRLEEIKEMINIQKLGKLVEIQDEAKTLNVSIDEVIVGLHKLADFIIDSCGDQLDKSPDYVTVMYSMTYLGYLKELLELKGVK